MDLPELTGKLFTVLTATIYIFGTWYSGTPCSSEACQNGIYTDYLVYGLHYIIPIVLLWRRSRLTPFIQLLLVYLGTQYPRLHGETTFTKYCLIDDCQKPVDYLFCGNILIVVPVLDIVLPTILRKMVK
jgi:hypothetical protein